jgi:hypothetical protein
MKASAFNGDVEILLFCRVQTVHVLFEFTATSMPRKKHLNQSAASLLLGPAMGAVCQTVQLAVLLMV